MILSPKEESLSAFSQDDPDRKISCKRYIILSALGGNALRSQEDKVRPNLSRRKENMLSKIPIDTGKLKKEGLDQKILRAAIIAELDAINLYEQMADMTQNKSIKKLLLDVAREEKTHVGEFQTLLLSEDPQQKDELEEGKKEVKQLLNER